MAQFTQASAHQSCQELVDVVCAVIETGVENIELTHKLNVNQLWRIFVLFGGMINALFFFVIWRIKELHVHPMPLFVGILAMDSTFLTAQYFSWNMCNFGLHKIFAFTVFYSTECED